MPNERKSLVSRQREGIRRQAVAEDKKRVATAEEGGSRRREEKRDRLSPPLRDHLKEGTRRKIRGNVRPVETS